MSRLGLTPGCAICYNDLQGAIGACIPCGHVFHEACYDRWVAAQEADGGQDVPVDEINPTCPMCMQSVASFQRIFLDTGMSPPTAAPVRPCHENLGFCLGHTSSNGREMDTIMEGDESGMLEVYYKSLYEKMKKEMEKLHKECLATEGQYEEALINQSRSHQELLDECLQKVQNEREKREELKKELKAVKHEYKKDKKEVQRLKQLVEERDQEKQKWRRIAMEKTRAVSKLTALLQEKQQNIEKLSGNPLLGATSISELIIKLNRQRAVSLAEP